MKKTLALILAIVMMAALAVPAFAEIDEEPGVSSSTVKAEGSNNCDVTYGVKESYTVSLPTAVNFAYGIAGNVQSQTATVSVTDFVINGSNKLVVTIDSTNGTDGGWAMIDDAESGGESSPVPYTITAAAAAGNGANVTPATGAVVNAVVSNDPVVPATTILEVASNVQGNGGGVVLTFATNGTKQAGNYSDQITFGVSIEANTP